jgi:hypothetical protein
MMRDQQLSAEKIDEFSGRMTQLLKERIVLFKRDEVLNYLDFLIPEYELPADRIGKDASKRQHYYWSEFLEFNGEEFIHNAYLCILKRQADDAGLQWAAEALGADECSRVLFLWHLRDSEEGRGKATEITGLWVRYRYHLACLEQKHLSRMRFGFLIKLENLSRRRIDEVLICQRRELAAYSGEMERRLMQHYNDTLKQLKRAVAEALTTDITR